MSHLPDQPHEVPFREVEHQEFDDDPKGYEQILGMGTVRDWTWWGGPKRDAEFVKELEALEKRRAKLGGFGFRA